MKQFPSQKLRDAQPVNGEQPNAQYVRGKQSALVRLGKRLRDPINAWFARQSLIGDQAIIDAELMPVLDELGANWEIVREELLPLIVDRGNIPAFGKISPDHRRIANTNQWKSFFFEGYGFQSEGNRATCPRTTAFLDALPNLVVAFFSIMEPGTHVPRHRGLTKAWLNCHLPLVVPQPADQCRMEVANSNVHWREGEWLIFDETNPHEVWNNTDEIRVVLFLQIRRPMTRLGNIAARAIYEAIRRTSFVRDTRKAIGA
ncbi:MAG: aspartyl/asparaginyl beta-hydroxylase domain-containing protein [Erythrobacter sp.]